MRGRLRATTGLYDEVDDDYFVMMMMMMSGYLCLQCLCGGVWGEMSRGPGLNSLSSLLII